MIAIVRSLYQTLKQEDGQDLVEYGLVVALVALGAVAGQRTLATKLNTAYTNLSTQVSSNIT